MDLSILVISKTYKLVNKLIKNLSDNKYLSEIKSEVLCSWNGLQKDLNKIIVTKDINLRIQMIKPYNFAINMNQLINMSTGKYILMINDDVFLDKNSIESGLNLLIKNQEIGIVGGLLRDHKGFLTHAGVSFNLLNSPYHFFEYLIKIKDVNIFKRSFFVPASTGALMLSRKDTLAKVKFNELYNVCGEDIELCLDVRQILGKEIWICNKFSGIHEAETTRRNTPNQGKNLIDKRRISKRYSSFLNNSNTDSLLKEYNFNKNIFRSIFKLNIKSWSRRFHTDFWMLILLNMIKIYIKFIIKTKLISRKF